MTSETIKVDQEVHVLPWWPEGPRPGLRTVTRNTLGVSLQEPFGRPMVTVRLEGLGLRAGQVVFALWTEKLLAGTIPGVVPWCTDPECDLPIYRRHPDTGELRVDTAVRGSHFAVFDDLVLPGVDLPTA